MMTDQYASYRYHHCDIDGTGGVRPDGYCIVCKRTIGPDERQWDHYETRAEFEAFLARNDRN